MRYAVFLLATLISAIFSCAVFPRAPILGVQPDLCLAFMLSMVFLEKTLTPVFYLSASGLMMDIFFSRAFGFYTLPYLIIGVLAYRFIWSREAGLMGTAAVGMLAWLVRDIIGLLFCWLIDYPVDIAGRYLSSTLPGIPIAGLCTLLAFLLMEKLYKNNFMWPAGYKAEQKNTLL